MLKPIITSLFLFSFGCTFAQQASDYQYVIVPDAFEDFVKDDYQMNLLLKTNLRKKNYEVIAEGAVNVPNDLQQNECLATKADIQNIKASFQNKLKVVFTDCNDKVVGEYFGSSKIKDFEKGYQDALNDALKTLALSNPKQQNKVVKKEQKKVDLLNPVTTINQETPVINTTDTEQIYFLNEKAYVLIKTDRNYKLIDKATKQTVIQFFPTSKENVYHALIESNKRNYQSVAFFSDNKIEVEYQKDQNIWEVKTYTK